MQRAAQKRDVSAYRFAARKTAYRLIYNGTEHGRRNVTAFRALVDKRLNIALRENAAP